MLQLNMLGEEQDGLTVPVEIEKIVIDVDKHNEFTTIGKLTGKIPK